MSEKRFVLWRSEDRDGYTDEWAVDDKLTGKRIDEDEVVDLLNEQQATITHLEKVNGKNFAKRRLLEQDNLVLRNENELLRQRYYALKKEIDRLDNNIIHLNEANDCRKKNLKIMELSNTEHNLKMLLANSDEQTERFIKGLQKENEQLRQELEQKKVK